MRCRLNARERASPRLRPTAIDRLEEESWRESGAAIRAKNRFWRAPMRRDAGGHENFLIAKNCDSESAKRDSTDRLRLISMPTIASSLRALTTKRPAVIGFAAILTNASVGFPRTICITARMRCRFAVEGPSRAPGSLRQHFLKPDTVFFYVLVYSGCSAFRFPSARSDKAISLH